MSWYASEKEQSDFADYLNRTWVTIGHMLLLGEDNGRYWQSFVTVTADSFIRGRCFSTFANFDGSKMENCQD